MWLADFAGRIRFLTRTLTLPHGGFEMTLFLFYNFITSSHFRSKEIFRLFANPKNSDSVAQLVEQQTLNLWVLSSSLSGVTGMKKQALWLAFLFWMHRQFVGDKTNKGETCLSLYKILKTV